MERRKSERIITNWKGSARVPASPIEVTVVDFSATGCRLRTSSGLIEPGRTILLSIDGWDELAGKVKWHKRGYCGVEFDEPAERRTGSRRSGAAARKDGGGDLRLTDRFGRKLPPLPALGSVKVL